jgi:hypothetical protein
MGRKMNLAANLSSVMRLMNSPPKSKTEASRWMRKSRAYREPESRAAASLLKRVRARV